MPRSGNWIVIHRDNDRSFSHDHYKHKRESVKHVYTINCNINVSDVTAIPYGLASINGDSTTLCEIQKEEIEQVDKVFCRMNVNNSTKERNKAVNELISNDLVTMATEQIACDDFYRKIKSHKYTMSLQGEGKDAMRTWESIFLGSIPIVSECVEMRHFDDMPLVYYPGSINREWLDSISMNEKSLKRARMSYWKNEILFRRAQL
jgi:hypothetical protein